MLRFGDIQYFLSDSPSSSRFKCWFEIIIDLFLMGLFMIVLLSWATIFNPESAGLICVYLDEDNYNLGIPEGRYIASRCLLVSGARFMLFYPYFLFFQFLTLMITHVLWLRVPRVLSKLGFYHDLFTRIKEIQPKFDSSCSAMVPTIIPDKDSLEDISLIYDKFIFLLTDKSYIKNVYSAKNVIMLVLISAFTCGNLFFIINVLYYKLNFNCDLNDGIDQRYFNLIVCNISPSCQLVAYFVFFQFLLFVIFILTILSLWNLKNMQQYKSEVTDLLGAESDRISGLPGFNDFVLSVTVNNKNYKDGGFFIQMVKFVFQSHTYTQTINIKIENEEKFDKDRFQIESQTIQEVALKLGLVNNPALYSKDHLFECIEKMRKNLNPMQLKSMKSIKKLIFEEIEMNPFYFSYLVTGNVSSNIEEQKTSFAKYRKFVQQLKSGEIWPNNIVIAAAANILNVKIFIIKSQSENFDYIDSIDRFEPYSNIWNKKYFIISLIYPNYYNLFTPRDEVTPSIAKDLYNFIHSKENREKLINMTREQVLRHISSQEIKRHIRKVSNDPLNAIQTNDMLVDPSSNADLVAARFRLLNSRTVNNRTDNLAPITVADLSSSPLLVTKKDA